MRIFAITALLFAGCAFDPGPISDDASADVDGGDDAQVPDAGDVDLTSSAPDLHRVPDGIMPGVIGWPCDTAGECDTGFCVDGYCCETDCDATSGANTCKSCNVPGQEGRCVFALAGTDPRQQCAQDPPTSCGQDGVCDGQGQCRKWNAGTACGATSCSSGVVTYAPACDGLGNCLTGSVESCYPYDCLDTMKCATDCTASPSECATGVPCTAGTCGKRADGQPCNVTNDCQSGHCEQGVCCASACSGLCLACNLAGTVGTCAPVPAGLDPLNQCVPSNRASCGLDGACDGSGACRKWVVGTPCSARSCMGDTALDARKCDGSGTCSLAVTLQACTPYSCNPGNGTCFRKCAAPNECATGHLCDLLKKKCQ